MVKNLKALREEHGLSQQKLGELLGMTQQAIFKYERTTIEPDIDTLMRLADILHTTVDYLIGRTSSDGDVPNRMNFTDEEERCIRQLRRQPQEVRDSFYGLVSSLSGKTKSV